LCVGFIINDNLMLHCGEFFNGFKPFFLRVITLQRCLVKRISFLFLILFFNAAVEARPVIIPAAPQLAATAYLLIDANTGRVLAQSNADKMLPPASLTKMMTSYIISSEIESGSISHEDDVEISVKAWKMGGSKMFVREGTRVKVGDLLKGVIIQSGNDASVALAEHVAGSEDAFADVMNQQAALLGMQNTQYRNATGWPEDGHYTTARDLSILARALISDFPAHYKIYSEKYFTYNGINQPNRNKLLFRDKSVDGLKTGHTEAAGYCLVASAEKNDMRLISVVMGTRTEAARATESQKLLAYGFRYYHTHQLYNQNAVINQAVLWKGKTKALALGVQEDIYLTVPRGSEDDLVAKVNIDQVIEAPITKGQELGNIVVSLDDEILLDIPLVALQDIEQAGIFSRLWDSTQLFFKSLF